MPSIFEKTENEYWRGLKLISVPPRQKSAEDFGSKQIATGSTLPIVRCIIATLKNTGENPESTGERTLLKNLPTLASAGRFNMVPVELTPRNRLRSFSRNSV